MQIQFSETDIPETASPRTDPLKYVVPESEDTDYIVTGKRFLNQIYLSEVKNAGMDPDKQLKVVVGGIYEGEGIEGAGKMNYYRIDMKDDKAEEWPTLTLSAITRMYSTLQRWLTRELPPPMRRWRMM